MRARWSGLSKEAKTRLEFAAFLVVVIVATAWLQSRQDHKITDKLRAAAIATCERSNASRNDANTRYQKIEKRLPGLSLGRLTQVDCVAAIDHPQVTKLGKPSSGAYLGPTDTIP